MYNGTKVRKFSSSIMAALVVVALFWGNCFTCPQLLAALQSHQPAHGCCHKNNPVSSDCQSQVLKHFVKAASNALAADLPAVAQAVEPTATVLLAAPTAPAAGPSPPDILSLQSSLRI
jgi:hypothetical protein